MLAENLSDMPLHGAIRENLRTLIAAGHDPLDVAEAAMTVAASLSIAVEGQIRTGSKLYAAGSALLSAVGECSAA